MSVLGSISVSYDTVESDGRSRVEVGVYNNRPNCLFNTESYSLTTVLFYFILLQRLPSLFFYIPYLAKLIVLNWHYLKVGDFSGFFKCTFWHCFIICAALDFTVSEDAVIEARTVITSAWTVRPLSSQRLTHHWVATASRPFFRYCDHLIFKAASASGFTNVFPTLWSRIPGGGGGAGLAVGTDDGYKLHYLEADFPPHSLHSAFSLKSHCLALNPNMENWRFIFLTF